MVLWLILGIVIVVAIVIGFSSSLVGGRNTEEHSSQVPFIESRKNDDENEEGDDPDDLEFG